MVAPHAGAWIEIDRFDLFNVGARVAPHAGAWIEIDMRINADSVENVAPHAGAWIEIIQLIPFAGQIVSPPTRGRGLK